MWGQHSPYSPDVISDSSLGINSHFPGIYRAFHSRRARRGSSSKRHEQLESLVRSAVLFPNALRMHVVVWLNAKVKQVHCLLDATRHLKPGAHRFFCPSLWLLLVRFFSVPCKSLKFKADCDINSLLYVSLCDIYLGTLVMTDSVDSVIIHGIHVVSVLLEKKKASEICCCWAKKERSFWFYDHDVRGMLNSDIYIAHYII